MAPVLDQLNLVVGDMARSIDFYRALGLDIPDDIVWRTDTGPHHVEIKMANGFELALDSEALARVYNAGWRAFKGEGDRMVMSCASRMRTKSTRSTEPWSRLGTAVRNRPATPSGGQLSSAPA